MKSKAFKICLSAFCLLISISLGGQNRQSGKKWWKESVFYQIYMPSYADSNGDGYGDFKGISGKLDYLESLGIKGIWLTPFLKSPKVDNGYDVADYYAIDPAYGTTADFKSFIDDAHKRGIKVIMDMVLNHTSTDCKWFQEARKGKDNPYRDYYIWKDNPNNWESFFGGTAWEYDSASRQHYYHKFDVRMADLNWQNPKVKAEIREVLRYWLNMGVDGFRLDVINFLSTDGITNDNPVTEGVQQHKNDVDQPGVKDAMRMIKSTVSEYPDRFIVGEIGSDKIEVLKQYQGEDLLDVVFNFNFGSIPEFSAGRIYKELQSMEMEMSSYPTLFFGSHDMPRMINRLANGNTKRAEALAALMLTAKGVPFIYYGEEIGMHNITAETPDEIVDIQGKTQYRLAQQKGMSAADALTEGNKHNRDKSRSPMQWTAGNAAGFTTGKPWIKINNNYKMVNAEKMQHDTASLLSQYKKLITLRNSQPALQYGSYKKLELNDDVISFTRTFNNDEITIIINFGRQQKVQLPAGATVLMGNEVVDRDNYLIYKIGR